MPAVRLEGFIELDGYFVALCVAHRGDIWLSWAEFTPDLEFGDGRSKVSVFRHRVPGIFLTKKESLDAAFEYAYQVVEDGTVEAETC